MPEFEERGIFRCLSNEEVSVRDPYHTDLSPGVEEQHHGTAGVKGEPRFAEETHPEKCVTLLAPTRQGDD